MSPDPSSLNDCLDVAVVVVAVAVAVERLSVGLMVEGEVVVAAEL